MDLADLDGDMIVAGNLTCLLVFSSCFLGKQFVDSGNMVLYLVIWQHLCLLESIGRHAYTPFPCKQSCPGNVPRHIIFNDFIEHTCFLNIYIVR